MAPLILLLSAYGIFYFINRLFLAKRIDNSFIGRTAMTLMLIMTGIAHFTRTTEMMAMLPDIIEYKKQVVYATGIFEFIAAVGILVNFVSRRFSLLLILFFLCIMPANIIGSIKQVALGGMENGAAYLFFRIPLQLFFIWWIYYFGIKINRKKS